MTDDSVTAAALAQPIVGAETHPGLVRSANEDSVMVHPTGPLWAVADGMGGHANGAWASQQVVAALAGTALVGTLDPDIEAVADALANANAEIADAAAAAGKTMGSTVVALLAAEGRYACLWSGDSRIYRLRDGALRQLTRDHSQVAELVAAGMVRAEDAESHPLANVVTRAIGADPELAIDVVEDRIAPGDAFLLCSDGLTKCLKDDEIVRTAAGLPPTDACRALIAATLARGAPDNVSVVIVKWPE